MKHEDSEFQRVYLTRYNRDMTEGRGPMVNDRCFAKEADARKYINSKLGVMGRKAPLGGWRDYGDWDVVPIIVVDDINHLLSVEIEEAKERALAKLTKEDRAVLGLP